MRTKLFGLSICVALTALGAASFASAVPNAARSTVTIKTLMTVTSATAVDADHNGKPSVGDYTIFRAVHRSPSTARVIGGGTAICTQIDAKGTLFDCIGEDHFAGGDIREAFRFGLSKSFKVGILGGTGVYQGAYGELNGTWLDSKETRARAVFTITTP